MNRTECGRRNEDHCRKTNVDWMDVGSLKWCTYVDHSNLYLYAIRMVRFKREMEATTSSVSPPPASHSVSEVGTRETSRRK